MFCLTIAPVRSLCSRGQGFVSPVRAIVSLTDSRGVSRLLPGAGEQVEIRVSMVPSGLNDV